MPSMDESWEMRNGLLIPNRSVLAAMTNKQSHADGTLSDEEIRFLIRRAEGGFGLITTAASHVQACNITVKKPTPTSRTAFSSGNHGRPKQANGMD